MPGNATTLWGLMINGRPLTPSEGHGQTYQRVGPAATQRTRTYDNGTCLTFGPMDRVDLFEPGHPFYDQICQVDTAIYDLNTVRTRHEGAQISVNAGTNGQHKEGATVDEDPYRNFRTEPADSTMVTTVTLDSGTYTQVPSKYAPCRPAISYYSHPNKSDIPGSAHNGGSTDTRFGTAGRPNFGNQQQYIHGQNDRNRRDRRQDTRARQRYLKFNPSGVRTTNHNQASNAEHGEHNTLHRNQRMNGHPGFTVVDKSPPQGYTLQDDSTLVYKHPLSQQGPAVTVPIHAGQQMADRQYAEKLRADRLREEALEQRYAEQRRSDELLAKELQAQEVRNERLREEEFRSNYLRSGQMNNEPFNPDQVRYEQPEFTQQRPRQYQFEQLYTGQFHRNQPIDTQGSVPYTSNKTGFANLQNEYPLPRKEPGQGIYTSFSTGNAGNQTERSNHARARHQNIPGYRKANRKLREKGNAEWAKFLDEENNRSRERGDHILKGDRLSGEVAVQRRFNVPLRDQPLTPISTVEAARGNAETRMAIPEFILSHDLEPAGTEPPSFDDPQQPVSTPLSPKQMVMMPTGRCSAPPDGQALHNALHVLSLGDENKSQAAIQRLDTVNQGLGAASLYRQVEIARGPPPGRASPQYASQEANVARTSGDNAGVGGVIDHRNRIFGQLPGTVRHDPSSAASRLVPGGRRLYERN